MPYGAGDLKLDIEYQNEKDGWIDCFLTFNKIRRHVHASNVFPPFPSLLDLLRAIHTSRLPHNFYWDEEGHGLDFEALPAADRLDTFRLRIIDDLDEKAVWVDAELDRRAVIDVFLAPLRAFVRHTSEELQQEWRFTFADMEKFSALLRQEIPPRNDHIGIQHFKFAVEHNVPFPMPLQWFTLEIFDIEKFVIGVADKEVFWPYWFSMLEKIALGKLPTQFQFHEQDLVFFDDEENSAEPQPPDEDVFFQYYKIQAMPVKDAFLFHLMISKTNNVVQDELLVDEVFDRRWFVGAFCDEFERFLLSEYTYLGPELSQFDLRNLPLERLKGLLS
jgi:hypothetical protein